MKYNLLISFLFISIVFQTLLGQENQIFDLEKATKFALEHHTSIKNADLDIELARQEIIQTTSIGLPQINANIGYNNYIEQPVSLIPAEIFGGNPGEFSEVVFGTKQNVSAGITLSQLLFNGSYIVGMQYARAFKKVAELGKLKTESAIKQAVVQTYTSYIILGETIKTLENNQMVVEKMLYEVKKIYEVGLMEYQNVEQAELQLLQLKSQISQIKTQRQNIHKLFNITIGLDANAATIIDGDTEDLIKFGVDKILTNDSIQVENHIDHKIVENRLVTQKLEKKYEQSKYLPSLSATLNAQYNAFRNDFKFIGAKYFPTVVVGVQLNIPIFSSFDRKSKVQEAQIKIDKIENEKWQLEQKLKTDTENAFNTYKNSIEKLTNTEQALKISNSIYSKEKIKFFEGISTSIDLNTAENQLYTAQGNYINSLNEMVQAKVNLLNTLDKL